MALPDNVHSIQHDPVTESESYEKKGSDAESVRVEGVEEARELSSLEYVDRATERAVTRKMDWRIIPTISWVYLMNMTDRVNIGNARLFNMEGDLGLHGAQYQIGVSVLFITYCLFEAPSNLIIKKMRPGLYLSGLTIAWGIVATFSSFMSNFASLLVCRLILGLCESGFFPGVVLYLSMFYTRKSLALRVAYFYSTAAIAGVVGGLIAYGVSFMDGYAGWRAWRWIILVNALPTLATGLVIPFILPNSPDTAKFLTAEDKENVRRIHDAQVGRARNLREIDWDDVKDGLKDWTTYAYCLSLFPCLCMLYSFVVFLPTIIKQFGNWSAAEVQALTIPVYAVGAIVYLVCARFSDVTQRRGYFVLFGIVTAMVGYAMLLSNKGTGVSYAGCCFVSVGIFVAPGISFAWVPSNNPRYGKRSVSVGLHLTFGNSAGVVSPFLFANQYAPTYRPGYAASIGMLGVSFLLNVALILHFSRVNKRRDEGKEDHLIEGKTEIEIEAMGEKSPRFRFSI
ncbi:major facilitator superfamily domain-containing protein [Thelonectria olida]|uniref:Major facilitator superfamily domain-containing protein n=1 Tax=Thelonectria olida TaxID=1576542 RepID=A0A9P8VWR7_9HYPO|nr:major facilitator superfamily domain-containing protein [Thelonectria olida]